MKTLFALDLPAETLDLLRESGCRVIEVKDRNALNDALENYPEEAAALASRAVSGNEGLPAPDNIRILFGGKLKLDSSGYRLLCADKEIQLTPHEFGFFDMLSRRPGVVFSREQLLDGMDMRNVVDRSVDSHVKRFRRKLDDLHPGLGHIIQTTYGFGYQLARTFDFEKQYPVRQHRAPASIRPSS